MPSPVLALSVNQSRPSILLSVTKAGQISVNIAKASLASVADREIFDDLATLTQTSSKGTARLYRDAAVAEALGDGGAAGANSLHHSQLQRKTRSNRLTCKQHLQH